ncbi:TPA: hypothetical protein ND482_001520 [Citrobacter farmeri]|nr:hypothetical protein [Citrobacter farmeri]
MPDGGFALSGLQIQRLLLSRYVGLISVAPSGANALLMPDGGFALSGLQIQCLLLARHVGLISVAPSGANTLLCRMSALPYPAYKYNVCCWNST